MVLCLQRLFRPEVFRRAVKQFSKFIQVQSLVFSSIVWAFYLPYKAIGYVQMSSYTFLRDALFLTHLAYFVYNVPVNYIFLNFFAHSCKCKNEQQKSTST